MEVEGVDLVTLRYEPQSRKNGVREKTNLANDVALLWFVMDYVIYGVIQLRLGREIGDSP